MKFVWKTGENANDKANILSEVFLLRYLTPDGFDYDARHPENSGKRISEKNVEQRSSELAYFFRNLSLHYTGDNFVQIWGDDFEYSQADWQYTNLTKMINYINEHSI